MAAEIADHNITTYLPYLGTSQYYTQLLEGHSPMPKGHEWNRMQLPDDIQPQTLTLPVCGGYTRIKNARTPAEIAALQLSDHTDWPHIHPATIATHYGRAPYAKYIMPELTEIYTAQHSTLQQLNRALHQCILRHLCPGDNLQGIQQMRHNNPDLYVRLHHERQQYTQPQSTILHTLMYLGPETLFAILPPLR